MRRFFFVFLAVSYFNSGYLFAQKLINEATISYKISTESANDKVAIAKSLEGALFTIYIKGTQSRTDMITALGTESDFFDSKSGKGAILKLYSGQKLMISLVKDNWLQKNQFYQNMKFTVDNAEQIIAGFKCKKATGLLEDGKILVVYFTPGIVLANNKYENAFAQLPGLPVQYELKSGKLIFKYILNNISYDPVPSAKFEIPTAGFRVMTYEENQQLKKGEN